MKVKLTFLAFAIYDFNFFHGWFCLTCGISFQGVWYNYRLIFRFSEALQKKFYFQQSKYIEELYPFLQGELPTCEKNLEWVWLAKFKPWTRQKKTQAYKISNFELLETLKTFFNDVSLENKFFPQ
jgi:hypothetical protein